MKGVARSWISSSVSSRSSLALATASFPSPLPSVARVSGLGSLAVAVAPSTASRRNYGGLKDKDRIFTNLYNDGEFGLNGAMKRVRFDFLLFFYFYFYFILHMLFFFFFFFFFF